MLKTIYDSIECRVRFVGINSETFKILIGLLQGDPNSTVLFNIVFAVILEITNKRLANIGIKLRLRIDKNFFKTLQSKSKGEVINILEFIFADDTGFCTETEEDCTWFGLTLSVKKTEFMIQRAILNNEFLKKPNIKIGGHFIKQVSEFKYLG